MSNISIACKISLSKKLRALIGKEGSITLTASNLIDGVGIGRISISSDTADSQIVIGQETSIMLTPIEVTDEIPEERTQSAIFTSIPRKGQKEGIIGKIAAVNAPEEEEIPEAVTEIETPRAFTKTDIPECKEWISNMTELVEAVNHAAQTKKSEIDINQAVTDRQKAVLIEQKEKEEAIDTPAWIVNDKYGMVTINDLGISLPLNSPFDLSNISARRIIASREFKGLLKTGYIKFLSPQERDDLVLGLQTAQEEGLHGLTVFDNHDEAMGAISDTVARNPIISEDNMMEIEGNDLEVPTEESTILNLTQNMPTVKSKRQVPVNTEPKRSAHGNTPPPNVKTVIRSNKNTE